MFFVDLRYRYSYNRVMDWEDHMRANMESLNTFKVIVSAIGWAIILGLIFLFWLFVHVNIGLPS